MNSTENNDIKARVADDIYNGINNIDVDLFTNYTSKNFELIPLISKLVVIRKINNITAEQIADLLTDEEVRNFSQICNLKEKTRICCLLKS